MIEMRYLWLRIQRPRGSQFPTTWAAWAARFLAHDPPGASGCHDRSRWSRSDSRLTCLICKAKYVWSNFETFAILRPESWVESWVSSAESSSSSSSSSQLDVMQEYSYSGRVAVAAGQVDLLAPAGVDFPENCLAASSRSVLSCLRHESQAGVMRRV